MGTTVSLRKNRTRHKASAVEENDKEGLSSVVRSGVRHGAEPERGCFWDVQQLR